MRGTLSALLDQPAFDGSTLDVVLKALDNSEGPSETIIKALPQAYRLRNRVVHGDDKASLSEVKKALGTLDDALKALDKVPHDTLLRAVHASARGVRGTKLPVDEPRETQNSDP